MHESFTNATQKTSTASKKIGKAPWITNNGLFMVAISKTTKSTTNSFPISQKRQLKQCSKISKRNVK